MPIIAPMPFEPGLTALALNTNSKHHEFIKKAIPAWLKETSPRRVSELKNVPLRIPEWNKTAPASAHQHLQQAIKGHWSNLNALDQALSGLQDVYTFAEPLLQKALKERYGVEVDVQQTWLRLYAPVATSWWTHDFASPVTSRTTSLLDAALHNFASHERFTSDSEFITRPDARGHFQIKPLKSKISIEQFKSLCRELDIGAQYQHHLSAVLLPTKTVASSALQHKVILSQKSALNAAAHLALMKKDISQDAYEVVQGILERRRNLKWHGTDVRYCNLAMMDTALTGITLIVCGASSSAEPQRLIAYIPHDPEHPLKEYASSIEFMTELTRQLRDSQVPQTSASTGSPVTQSYQQFFSQFVAHEQRGYFFSRLNERLSKVTWRPAAPGSNLPSWRETPVEKPDLQFSVSSIEEDRTDAFTGDLWRYFCQRTLNKILNDARGIAISTAYVDRMARWAWWDNLEKMLSDILNVALLVATPLAPGLGTLMLAYTAYQLTEEVVEGVVDLAEGHLAEAGEQIIGVLENVVQLGTFAAAGAVGTVAQAKLSPFFEGLKPVQLANAQTRLWNPDLKPYQCADVVLAPHVRPDAQGIHLHQGRRILPLNNQHFEVLEDAVTGQPRIRHPRRVDAYAPTLRHNSHGAWVCETENPRAWEGPTLMRRLGHSTDGFNDEQLEQIREISGTEEGELRRMHVENAPPPPLLSDTLQRLATTAPSPAPAPSPEVARLLKDFPQLPENIAQTIIDSATPSERRQLTHDNHLPLRLKAQARELQFETQSVRAAQGLYQDSLSSIDTERLVLGTLRINTDTFGDLRIEIRQGSSAGELRCSAGPEEATQVRILVRDADARYHVRDAADQPLHAADTLLEAILQAMGKDRQAALGYKPGDSEAFRQWLLAKTAAPGERRVALASPPIRAAAEHQTLLLVRGPALSRAGETLHERIQDLHPDFSSNEVDTFAEALIAQGEPMKAIEQLENELDQLRVILNRWEYQQPESWGPDTQGFRNGGGKHIARRLLACFRRSNTDLGPRSDPAHYALDLSHELLSLDLQTWWSKRPPELQRYLDKVSVLKLDNTRFSAEPHGLLNAFPNLRQLSAKGCELKRMPHSIGSQRKLEHLRLSHNQITLDTVAVEQLKHLTYLEVLRLEDNPLQLSPDIGRMPRLKVVVLRNTGLSTWPTGTLAKTRPRGFLLDLRDNPLTSIPDVVPGSPQAWTVARTRLSIGQLPEVTEVGYQQIRRSVALPPEPSPMPGALADSEISSQYTLEHWSNVPGWGVDRANLWSRMIDEPQAERFMAVLADTQDFADFRAGGEYRHQLLERVWRMLDAVHIDTDLRDTLFTMAIAPVDCADAGAQLFNNMGIRVMASEAHSYSTDPAQLENKLVNLARGAAHLDLVNDIARADVQSRGGNPDEVEVYLAYHTGLAERLNLPWQSAGMLYRPVSGVTDAMIDQAYSTVQALSEGDGLVNKMLEQDFWQAYLEERYPVRLEANKRRYQRLSDRLETLRTTQHEWFEATTDSSRAELRSQLGELMNDLPAQPTVVLAERPISEADFDRMLVDLGEEEKQLSRRLTRDAMRRAGL